MKAAILACALLAAPGAEAVRTEIEGVLRAQSELWSLGALEAFCSFYAEDATFVSPSGTTSGRAQLLERYRKKYPDRSAMGTLRLEVREVRLSGADVASVVARWSLTYPDKPEASGWTLLVLNRIDGRWTIVQDASM